MSALGFGAVAMDMNGRLTSQSGMRTRAGTTTPTLDLDIEESQSLDSLVQVFWMIEDALGDYQNVVRLPCRLFLESLPEALRGPLWSATGHPEVVVEVDPWDLLCKIKMGRVTYPLARILADMPSGWMAGPPDAEVPLDVAKVTEALPDNLRKALSGS